MEQIERIITDQEQLIREAVDKLQRYIEKENYSGWDPYDALKSPLFKLPFFRSNKLIRFSAQQLVKRSSVNLRPLLRVPKGYNPVTLGLVLQGYCYQLIKKEIPDQVRNDIQKKIEFLIDELERLQSEGFSGSCWGYDFYWEARHAKINAFKPTVVATGFISNALFICYNITGNQKAKKMLISSADFVLNDLNRTYHQKPTTDDPLPNVPFAFSYSPFDKQVVFNASMKGVRILSQAYSFTKEHKYIEVAKNAVEYVVQNQNTDGSWYYSKEAGGKYVDNYHTGYVLDCLDEYRKHSNDSSYNGNIKKGYEYYKNNFLGTDAAPKFYNNKKYPIDCTAVSQFILSLIRFGDREIAMKIAGYMIENMRDKVGFFYFRDYGNRKDKTSFMRWSNAWMFTALTSLNNKFTK